MARTKVAKNLLDSQSVFAEVKNGKNRSFVKDSNAISDNVNFATTTRKISISNPKIYSTESIESKLRNFQLTEQKKQEEYQKTNN